MRAGDEHIKNWSDTNQMKNYLNEITGEQQDSLPSVKIQADGSPIVGATIEQWADDGWVKVAKLDGAKLALIQAEETAKAIEEAAKIKAETAANEQAKIDWQAQAKLIDADFTTWSKHERFLLSLITKIDPNFDLAKEYEAMDVVKEIAVDETIK